MASESGTRWDVIEPGQSLFRLAQGMAGIRLVKSLGCQRLEGQPSRSGPQAGSLPPADLPAAVGTNAQLAALHAVETQCSVGGSAASISPPLPSLRAEVASRGTDEHRNQHDAQHDHDDA